MADIDTSQDEQEELLLHQRLQSLDHLTEDDVKRAALRFLKSYYKYRPSLLARPLEGGGYIEARLGVHTDDGIIADGYLSYLNAEGETFVATFEATSYLTRDELRYRYQAWMLFWDALAVAAAVTAMAFGYVFITKLYSIRDLGLWLNIAGLTGAMLVVGLSYRLLFRRLHRYRYIYAIEQFKQYHADEQWIAVAEDVFEGSRKAKRHLKELKQQCVRNGFGLIFVSKDMQSKLAITPARRELFDNRRAIAQFITQNELTERLRKNRYAKKIRTEIQKKVPQLIPEQLRSIRLLRYQRSYLYQIIICCIALAIVTAIFIEEWRRDDIIIYKDGEYAKIVEKLDLGPPEESEYVVTDPSDVLHLQPFIDVQGSYLNNPNITLLQTPDDRYQPYLPPPNQFIRVDTLQNAGDGLFVTSRGEVTSQYSCAEVRAIKGTNYIIQDSFHPTLEAAVERINELGFYGFSSNVLWLRCFRNTNTNDRYLVFLDFLYPDRQTALIKLNQYQSWLKDAGLYNYELMLREWKDL